MAANVAEIDEQIEELKMLMKIWLDFYRILTTVFYVEDPQEVARLDPEFQKIKTIVAEHHSRLMTLIKKDPHIGQSVLTTVKRTISLDGFGSLSPIEINKTLIEWHCANILFNETIGSLECDKDKIIRKRQDKIPRPPLGQRIKTSLESPKGKAITLLVVAGIVGGILYVYWDPIRQNPMFIQYFKPILEKVLQPLGLDYILTPPGG
ncbi:MAG TPA: hypothetical protein PLZ55_02155 [bacterium]|nr:hypothetical protein [bacterium]HPO07443.1 hypothetical protein [bacterium]